MDPANKILTEDRAAFLAIEVIMGGKPDVIGPKYGVSSKTVRRACKQLDVYFDYRRADMEELDELRKLSLLAFSSVYQKIMQDGYLREGIPIGQQTLISNRIIETFRPFIEKLNDKTLAKKVKELEQENAALRQSLSKLTVNPESVGTAGHDANPAKDSVQGPRNDKQST